MSADQRWISTIIVRSFGCCVRFERRDSPIRPGLIAAFEFGTVAPGNSPTEKNGDRNGTHHPHEQYAAHNPPHNTPLCPNSGEDPDSYPMSPQCDI